MAEVFPLLRWEQDPPYSRRPRPVGPGPDWRGYVEGEDAPRFVIDTYRTRTRWGHWCSALRDTEHAAYRLARFWGNDTKVTIARAKRFAEARLFAEILYKAGRRSRARRKGRTDG